jgi:hypothetical protein
MAARRRVPRKVLSVPLPLRLAVTEAIPLRFQHAARAPVPRAAGEARRNMCEQCTTADARREVVCFADDDPTHHGDLLNEIPVMGVDEARRRFPGARLVAAVGDPRTRQRLVERAASEGFAFDTLVDPGTRHSRWVPIGEGSAICAGCILTTNTTNIRVGPHAQINLDCTIGHDVVLETWRWRRSRRSRRGCTSPVGFTWGRARTGARAR